MRKLVVFLVCALSYVSVSFTPAFAADKEPVLLPDVCPAGGTSGNPTENKVFSQGQTDAEGMRTFLRRKISCPSACFDVRVTMTIQGSSGLMYRIVGTNKCTDPTKLAKEQQPPRGCGTGQKQPQVTIDIPQIKNPLTGTVYLAGQTIGPKARCDAAAISRSMNSAIGKLETAGVTNTTPISQMQSDFDDMNKLPSPRDAGPMNQAVQDSIKSAFTDAPAAVTAAKQADPDTFNKLLECQTSGCTQAKIDEYSNKLGLTMNPDTANKWAALAASNPDATATVPPSGTDQTKPEETFQDPEAKKRDFGFPTDSTHTLPASIDNAARLACEYQSAQGRACDATNAAAVGNAIVQMETGGRNPTCTGSYCGWGQLGSNETRWALQEVNKWANSDNLSPEAKAYAQSLMTRAEQIGANYAALNADPALGPALLMARLSNTRLSDADPGTPALTNIQAMTDDVRTQAKLGFLNQFMPAGWSGGQMQNWDAPLSGGMQSAIGNQYQRIGATTVNQALATMDTMSKYVNPINAGVQNYNNYLSAVGAGQVEFTSAAPAVRNSPFSFTGNNDNGYLAPLAGYGSSPFANANPAPFQNQQTYQPSNQQSYQQPSSNGGSSYQQASYGSGSGSYQQGAYSGVNTYAQASYVAPKDTTSNIPAVASLIVQPADVSRGGSYRISWSSVGMSPVNPCQVVQPDLTVLSISNEGSKLVTTKASSTEDVVQYSLRCVSARGQRIERSASVRIH